MVTLNPSRFTGYEFKNKVYKVDLPKDHLIEDIIKPEYWAHVARYLQPSDEIIAVCEANTYRLHLFVVNSGSTFVKVQVIAFTELSKEFDVPVEADTNYIIEHCGNFHKWRVRRKSDNEVLVSQLRDRSDAVKYLGDYKKALVVNKRETIKETAA